MFIGRRTRGLNDENVVASDVFLYPDVGLPIGEGADRRLTKWHADVFADAFSQLAVGRAAKDF